MRPPDRAPSVAVRAASLTAGPRTPDLLGGSYVVAEMTTTHAEDEPSADAVIDIRTGEPGPVLHSEFPATTQRIETGIAPSGHQVYGELVVQPDPESPEEDRDVIVVGPTAREQLPGGGAPPPDQPCDFRLPNCGRPPGEQMTTGIYTLDGTPDLDGLPVLMQYFHQPFATSALTALVPEVVAARRLDARALPSLSPGVRVLEATAARVVLDEPQALTLDGRTIRGAERSTWLASDDGWRLSERRRVLVDSSSRSGVRRVEERVRVRILAVQRDSAMEAGFLAALARRTATGAAGVQPAAGTVVGRGDELASATSSCPDTYRIRETIQPGGSQGLVLAHGFMSSPCVWPIAAGELRARLGLTAILATQSGWRDAFESQGTVLQHEMGALGQQDWVMVAHSMGGVVSRVVAQRALQGATPRVRGVLTIATPHDGAPIARATEVATVGGAVVGAGVAAAVLRTLQLMRAGRTGDPRFLGAEWMVASALWLGGAAGTLALWYEMRTPSLRELQPGSAALAAIAGRSEAGLRRVRVVAQPKTGWLSVRTFCDAQNQHGDTCARNTGRTFRRLKFHAALNGIIGATFAMVGQGWITPGYLQQSLKQLGAAAFMWTGDEVYKIAIGGGLGRRSDGVVPVASQRAWTTDREYLLDGGWTPSHNGLLTYGVAIDNVEDGLRREMGVPR